MDYKKQQYIIDDQFLEIQSSLTEGFSPEQIQIFQNQRSIEIKSIEQNSLSFVERHHNVYIQTDNKNFLQILRMVIFEYFGTLILSYAMISAGNNDFQIHLTIFFDTLLLTNKYYPLIAILFAMRQSNAHFHAGVTLMAMFSPNIQYEFYFGVIQIITSLVGIINGALLSQLIRGMINPPFLPDYSNSTLFSYFFLDMFATLVFQIINLICMDPKTQPKLNFLTTCVFTTVFIYPCRKLATKAGGNLNVTMTLGYFIAYGIIKKDLSWAWSIDCIVRSLASLVGTYIGFNIFYSYIQKAKISGLYSTYKT